ncbi:MAG: hypothetical protein WBQ86_11230 [Candidatus Binatus sp.]
MDHIVIFNERHLRRVLFLYVDYLCLRKTPSGVRFVGCGEYGVMKCTS